MPKLAAVVDSLDTVSEAHRDLYVERDGKYVLDVDGVEDVTGLKSALEAQKLAAKEAKEAKAALTQELADLKRKQEAGTAGITQETLDRWNAEKKAEIEAKEAEIAKRDKELRALKLDSQAEKAFLDAGGRPEKLAAAMKLNAGRYDLNDQGAVVLMGADGKAASGTLADHFARAFREEMPELYLPSGAGGGGAQGGGRGAADTKTLEAQIEAEKRAAGGYAF